MYLPFSIKKVGLGIIGFIVLLTILLQILHNLHTGVIVITSDTPNNTITLTQTTGKIDSDDTSDDNSDLKSFTGHNKLSVRVDFGQYIASVQGNSIGSTQLINIHTHKTLRYTINPISTTGMAPVAFQSAQNLATSDTNLVYLDTTTRQLDQISSNNTISVLGQGRTFQDVQWANASFGVAQDNDDHLWVIDNGTVSPLQLPQPYSPSVTLNYAVASNQDIYVSFGATVYFGNASGNFKKLYTAKTPRLGLTAGPSQVIITQFISLGEGKQTTIEVGTDGKVTPKDFDLGTVAWSPNGQYIASADEGGGTIYNNTTGDATTIPNVSQDSFINGLAWLNNTTLFFSTGGQVWVYDLSTQQSKLIANTPLNFSATELSVDNTQSYLYVLTGDSSGNSAIRRIGLRGQTVPRFIYQLQDILPDRLDNYSLSLINFAGTPVIPVQPYPDAPAGNYLQQASTELTGDGFDISKLNLQITSIIPGQ